MKRKAKSRCLLAVAVIMSTMIFVTPILAQQDEFMAGRIAGEQAARANTNGTLWLAAGCLFTWLGLLVAYVYEPNPPATLLLGKSPEYVAAYTDAYKTTAKSVQSGKALTGCIVGTIVTVVIYAAAFAAAADSTDDDPYYYY